MDASTLGRAIFRAWQRAKRRRGIRVHISEHTAPAQNLIEADWDADLNAEDKAFDMEVAQDVIDNVNPPGSVPVGEWITRTHHCQGRCWRASAKLEGAEGKVPQLTDVACKFDWKYVSERVEFVYSSSRDLRDFTEFVKAVGEFTKAVEAVYARVVESLRTKEQE